MLASRVLETQPTHPMIHFRFMVSSGVLNFFLSAFVMLKHSYAWSSESSESPNSPLSLFSLASDSQDHLETTEDSELEIQVDQSSVDFEHESVVHNKVTYPCALVSWFSTVGDLPCPDTGMWKVVPDFNLTGGRAMSVVHLDTILRSAHLMGVAGSNFIPSDLKFHNS